MSRLLPKLDFFHNQYPVVYRLYSFNTTVVTHIVYNFENCKVELNFYFTQEQDDPSTAHYPDYYVEHIRKMSQVVTLVFNDNAESRLSMVDSLRTALRTQPLR